MDTPAPFVSPVPLWRRATFAFPQVARRFRSPVLLFICVSTVSLTAWSANVAHCTESKRSPSTDKLNSKDAADAAQLICGPRCVDYMLRWYGIEESLHGLIKELQWPDLWKGTSMDQLAAALQRRNIEVFAARVLNSETWVWNEPVLLHIPGDSDLGHFQVWLPGETANEGYLWDGGTKYRKISWNEINRKRSETVLFTSSDPISESQIALALSRPWWRESVNIVLVCMLGITSVTVLRLTAQLLFRQSNVLKGFEKCEPLLAR